MGRFDDGLYFALLRLPCAMPETDTSLPLTESYAPADAAGLAAIVARAYQQQVPLYPVGGGTALAFGLPAKLPGWGIDLRQLNATADYPARDMTITVEAGITLAQLAATLAAEGQRLPIDAAAAEQATLGGLIATNFSGPSRYGHGTIRDYVIGIRAVDGRGVAFKAGGRVVKNVAGYDFCKLLCGSLGTLAVVEQVTLKVVPLAERQVVAAIDLASFARAEELLAALVTSATTPSAIELLAGPRWLADTRLGSTADNAVARLVVGLEGSTAEVEWMTRQLFSEWRHLGADTVTLVEPPHVVDLWHDLTAAGTGDADLVLKFNLRPSRVAPLVEQLTTLYPGSHITARAGNGVVLVELPQFPADDVARVLIQQLQPAAIAAGGRVVVWSSREELTRQAVWGGGGGELPVMRRVKQAFDPAGLLNPGRFVF